jgi:AraC-like DNA-binding protein
MREARNEWDPIGCIGGSSSGSAFASLMATTDNTLAELRTAGALSAVVARAALSKPVRCALAQLVVRYAERVTVNDLAAASACTTFQLIRAFRRELGITPHALLLRVRILRGTALLMQGEGIADIATRVGFVDQTHFTRHFKRVHGSTPARYACARAPQRAKHAGASDDRYAAAAC